MMVEDSALVSQVEGENDANDVGRVSELTEWAREKLASRLKAEIPNIILQGGLAIVTEEFGIMLSLMRAKIMEAWQMKLIGFKNKTRFGAFEWIDPVLPTSPSGKSVWVEIDHIETKNDKLSQESMDWRRKSSEMLFLAKPPENGIFPQMFQDLLDGMSAFFTSMPEG